MELRPYQREDAEQIKRYRCYGIFNEQRTGKTPTAITVVSEKNLHKVLILCPKSTVYTWAEEYTLWSRGKPAIVIVGSPQKRANLLKGWKEGAVVMSYDTLKTTSNSAGMIDMVLQHNPDGVIADEAHRFKNTSSKVFQAMKRLMNVPYRYALTGTPAHGKPEEIFAILHWLFPKRFTGYWKFIDEFFVKRREVLQNGRSFINIVGFQPGGDVRLQKLLSQLSVQRKRSEVMPWLPKKDYQDIKLPLTDKQIKYLAELKEYFETEEVVVQGILDRLIRYRQVCLHPGLLALSGDSPKLSWLLDYINDYPDTPTIVFTKFTSFIKLVEKELIDKKISFGTIIGETPAADRKQFVDEFQNGKINLLLVNIDAGKEGLTLDRGECIIFTDQYPPSSDIQQAEDRFVATTEYKADKPHKIIRLMMKGSYDEQVYKLVQQRASMTDLLNDYKKYLERR